MDAQIQFLKKSIANSFGIFEIFVLRKPRSDQLQQFTEFLKQNKIKNSYFFENHRYVQNDDIIQSQNYFDYPIKYDKICEEIQEMRNKNGQQTEKSNVALVYNESESKEGPQSFHYCLSVLIAYLVLHYQSDLEANLNEIKNISNKDREQVKKIIKPHMDEVIKEFDNGTLIYQIPGSQLFETSPQIPSDQPELNQKVPQNQQNQQQISSEFIESNQNIQKGNSRSEFNQKFIQSTILTNPNSDGTPTPPSGNVSSIQIQSEISNEQPPQKLPDVQPKIFPQQKYLLPGCLKFKSFKPEGFKCLQIYSENR